MAGPHRDQPLLTAGADPDRANGAMVLVHGRGASAESILQFAHEIGRDDVAYFAPQAKGNTWYPHSFMAPIQSNEPGLSSGLRAIEAAVDAARSGSLPLERVLLLGFSQGACLTSEFTARNPRRYAGVVVLSGGLIGPEDTPRDYDGSLEGTPIFLGCGDRDPHIPIDRVHETAAVFERMEAAVTERVYEGMGHGVNAEELSVIREMVADGVPEGPVGD